MSDDRVNDNLVLVRFCPDHIAAEVLAGLLRSESVPAVVSGLGPIPGLEAGAEVLVPASWLPRAQRLLARQEPSDDELTELAVRTPPDRRQERGWSGCQAVARGALSAHACTGVRPQDPLSEESGR